MIVTLVYAADEQMAMPLAASIASAALNFRTADACLDVVVIDGGLSVTSVGRLVPPSLDPARSRVRVIAPPSINTQGIELHRYGVAALYRLALPCLLPECRRAIYLDADTIVEHDLLELWDEANQGTPLLARQDWMFPVMSHPFLRERCGGLGMEPEDPYFNSGVLVLDLEEWRVRQYGQRVLEFLRANSAHCPWPDQDALNAVFRGRWKPLDARWNRYPAEVERLESAGIIHYIGGDAKPWLNPTDGRLASLRFRHYLQATNWAR